jgi:hypothetical protein
MPFDFTISSLICQGGPRQSSKLCLKGGGRVGRGTVLLVLSGTIVTR